MTQASRRVLLVDDDPTSLAVLRGVFERLGCEVETREQAIGTSAALLGSTPPDLVVLDVDMPALRGDALVTILRKRWPSIFCVLYSSLAADELERARSQSGANAAVSKTGRLSEIRVQFSALLEEATKTR